MCYNQLMTIRIEDVYLYTKDQHCTFKEQDGENDYSFSHTAGYCGKPQPRFCGCGFCYGNSRLLTEIVEEADNQNLTARELTRLILDVEPDDGYYDEAYLKKVLTVLTTPEEDTL